MFGNSTASRAVRKFLRDESGAAGTDGIIVLGGSIWMAFALVSDVAEASLNLTNDINDRLEYANIISEIMGDFGPDAANTDGSLGNETDVGSAGENTNGDDDWGDGTSGQPG